MPNTFRMSALAIQLAEGQKEAPDKIQVIRVGTFHHPQYGKFEVTKDHLLAFKKNFDARVRGIDLALDYGHDSEGEAAAWFKDVILSDDGTELWAVPDWTPGGAEAVLSKRFRYVSADFNFDYQDNETLVKHGPTLLGAGLTNRPVVKGQAPVIELTEGKGSEVDPKDKQIEELKAKIAELEAKLSGQMGEKPKMEAMEKELKETTAQLSEAKSELTKMKESSLLAEKKAAFDKKLSEGSVVEAQREAFMSGDMGKFLELAQPVKLSVEGHGNAPAAPVADVQDEVITLAQKAVGDKRATDLVDGIRLVLSENKDLRTKYEQAQA
jgi:phage I-like protein